MILTREIKILIMKEEPVKKKISRNMMMKPMLTNPWELRCYACNVMMRVNNAFALPWSDCSHRQCPASETDRNGRQDLEPYDDEPGGAGGLGERLSQILR